MLTFNISVPFHCFFSDFPWNGYHLFALNDNSQKNKNISNRKPVRRDQSRAYYKQKKFDYFNPLCCSCRWASIQKETVVCLFAFVSNKKPEDSSEEATARAYALWQLSTCQTAVKVLFWRMWECDVVLTSPGEGLVPELRCVAKCVNLWNATVSVCECERFEWVTELTAARACVCVRGRGILCRCLFCCCCCCCCWLILFCICILFFFL